MICWVGMSRRSLHEFLALIMLANGSASMNAMTKSTWRQQVNIKPIRSDEELHAAFRRLEAIFQAEPGTPEADEMEGLVKLIERYEYKYYPIQSAIPL